ncbi:prenyltransferase [Posidoniimonas polymericola]|uniref:Prenyltransferase n=1 Tax=Posidoniimonas polymericola TaxID=2528002 RepID=A0A5C5YMG3_9BACT|nr:UbiA family prenyltransferase [Posidoniimonas polymericola]TWT75987.1 prenyltransferase [Posidoniimonas polymericola]
MRRGALAAYLELMRFSNVLTAVADVWMGMAVSLGALPGPALTACITVASVCLYLSGMVLNDVLDAAHDARDRSTRPIPSGRVGREQAMTFGLGLMGAGLVAAGLASVLTSSPLPAAVGVALACTIYAYDAWPKPSPLKPLLMGACRGLNALLGMSLVQSSVGGDTVGFGPRLAAIPLGLLIYIVGVTLFARNEAAVSRRAALARGSLTALLGVAVLAAGPLLPANGAGVELRVAPLAWGLLWVVTALLIARRFAAALLQPRPATVQAAVGNAIQGVIVIDAALAWGYAGQLWGLAILALLPPTMLLSRRVPQT